MGDQEDGRLPPKKRFVEENGGKKLNPKELKGDDHHNSKTCRLSNANKEKGLLRKT